MKCNPQKKTESNSKYSDIKKQIIKHYIYNGDSTIPSLANELQLSIPTVTKVIDEMVTEGYINNYGKIETSTGRQPYAYGLNSDSGYFIGVEIKRNGITIGVINFKGDMIELKKNIPYKSENSIEALNELCKQICSLSLIHI